MLKFTLLGFLNYTPMTGYELEGWVNASTGNFWHAELSQIYKTLKQLEKAVDRDRNVIMMSLGWLAREGHVIMENEGKDDYKVTLRF